MTPNTAQALGIDKLLSAGGAAPTAVYTKYCVLSAKYQVSFSFMNQNVSTATTDAPIVPPSQHFMHSLTKSDEPLTVITTQSSLDSAWNQPDVRRKYVGAKAGHILQTATAVAINGSTLPAVSIVWKGTVWPHKLLDKTFTDYVSDDNSFGQAASKPTNYCGIQFGGLFSEGGSATRKPPNEGYCHMNVVFTCLFKDIAGPQS